ncbi:putative choline transporter, neither null mutation nor overexpression affects choline transport [Linnemannia schmuckeri]|uniref:Protein PNS1 n=1 Tax=Linnemannia schmuckeri TaxID=64567 RepID=A0A9P5S4B9_9FUNG|nr:putative choline transporter, neither null mutation nor overexpression affects choline transport [Linnemannia schmuckeri]
MSNYPPPNTGYYPPQPQQQPYYGAQPQPQYVPLQQQTQWGLQPQQQQQQQNYYAPQGQPMPPPTYDGSINPDSGLPTKFNPKPKYNDLWAAILFAVQLAGFVVLSYFAITNALKTGSGPGGSRGIGSLFSTGGLITLCISVGVGAIFSVVYFFLTVAFPTFLIKATLLLSILLYLGVAVYYLYLRMWIIGGIALVFGVLYAFMWFAWKSRIPFASVMLKTVTSVSRDYPATYAVSFLGLITQVAYSIYFLLVFAGVYDYYYNSGTSSGNNRSALFYVLVVFAVFSFYWTSQVLSNIVHTTICGVYATYYFMAGSPQGMTKSPTIESMKRACTTSFGSICFGSLIIAVIQTLRFIANMARGDGDGIMAFVACCIDCILACLQGIAEFINKYAFAQVAIYGKPYMQAARDTWTIIQDRGIEQIINDNLIGNVWGMAAIFSGFLSGLGTYLYLHFAKPAFNANDQLTIALIIVGFVMGLQICFTVGTVIDSGVVTTFVCLAEDPAALARTKPDLFARIQATWPEVVQGVRY